jgi:hypothetical protein
MTAKQIILYKIGELKREYSESYEMRFTGTMTVPAGLTTLLDRISLLESILPLMEEEWISVKDRLPEADTPVLIFNDKRILRACYIPKYHINDNDSEYEGDYLDYDEKNDEYYWPEGWYECNYYEEVHFKIDEVTHWRPLPAPPERKEDE